MATKLRLEFSSEGFQAILESQAVADDIERRTQAVADAAGDGMVATMMKANFGGSPRPMGVVATDTAEAMRAEAVDKALSKALDAGR